MDIKTLSQKLGIHPLVAKLLIARGIDDEASARAFLHPSLDALTPLDAYDGLAEVADRLESAIADGEGIVIFGDYDCDGICATSILLLYLKSRGADVTYFIPDRREDGYGITYAALDKVAEECDAHVLISVDCGITAVDEVDYAQNELGFEVLITDHHQPGGKLPDCPVFNPHLTQREDAFKPLCGAGVALRLVEKMGGLQASKKFYDIAALATVADVVPLVGDNRLIAHFGLMLINSRFRKGLTMLAENCVKGKVGAYDIAFRLAPRINAMGRVKNAREVVELFTSSDAFLLGQLVKEIEEANAYRQQLTDDLTDDCLDKLKKYDFSQASVIVEFGLWDEGVLGIAAARIVGKFNRPTILLTRSGGKLKGSGRSIPGVDILDCVRACSRWLEGFGGHTAACGLSMKEQDLDAFRIAINEYAASKYGKEAFAVRDDVDALIEGNITPDIAEQIDMLAPFGEGNPAPVFAIDCNECGFIPIGDGSHLKGKLHGMETLDFFAADDIGYLNSAAAKRLVVDIQTGEFNNVKRAEAIVRKVLPKDMPSRGECMSYLLRRSALDDGGKDAAAKPWDGKVYAPGIGTVYVAFDPDRAAEFAKAHGLECHYGEPPTYMPEDAVVVCPRKPLPYYRRAIYLDPPILSATAAALTPNAEIYFAKDGAFAADIAAKMPSDSAFAGVYKAIRSACYLGDIRTVSQLFDAVKDECTVDETAFEICFYIFWALKFLRIGAKIECVKVEKTSLDASALYRALARAGKNG